MRDVICNAYACFGGKDDEQGINLANQVCRWKDEMISVEIDIKITGFGTVCTSKKIPTTKSNIGAISSTIQQHQKAIQVTTYTNVQQHIKQMYILFVSSFFFVFVWYI